MNRNEVDRGCRHRSAAESRMDDIRCIDGVDIEAQGTAAGDGKSQEEVTEMVSKEFFQTS